MASLSEQADDFVATFTAKAKGLDEAARDTTAILGELGAEFIRERILNSGTAWTRSQGRDGRLDKGDMFDGVSARRSGNQHYTRTQFGWLNQDPHYARFQDQGFVQHGSGKTVQGMYALSDAITFIETMWYEEMGKRIREL